MRKVIGENAMRKEICTHKEVRNTMKSDIQNKADIESVVNGFYDRVRRDEMLSPVFASRIADEAWPEHLQRMYAFWNAILFAETGFQGNPMQKHLTLPVNEEHFNRWLTLFRQTVDENFSGPKAEEAKSRARSIAGIMNFKIETLRK